MGEGLTGWFDNIVNYGVSIIWGNNDWLIASNPWYGLLMFVLIGAGLYFTVATRFIQFRHFGHMWQLLRVSNQGRKDGGISSFDFHLNKKSPLRGRFFIAAYFLI